MSAARTQDPRALTPRQERLLRRLWGAHGKPLSGVVEDLGTTRENLLAEMEDLFDIGVVEVDADDLVQMVPPRVALANLLASQTALVDATMTRLNRMGGLVVALGQEGERSRTSPSGGMSPDGARVADVEILHGAPPESLLRSWITAGHGDLKFMRPEQWGLPDEGAIASTFRDAAARGHGVQCIYPVRALVHARTVLDEHRDAGEDVRLVPEVPLEMGIVGDAHAMVVAGLGGEERHTLVVREPALVRVLIRWFDNLWVTGAVMPDGEGSRNRDDDLRMLLAELSRGARDEQIARTLGLGLRTVRRRVADLMIELGAESRFQAGVEAARRGWV